MMLPLCSIGCRLKMADQHRSSLQLARKDEQPLLHRLLVPPCMARHKQWAQQHHHLAEQQQVSLRWHRMVKRMAMRLNSKLRNRLRQVRWRAATRMSLPSTDKLKPVLLRRSLTVFASGLRRIPLHSAFCCKR
jgi:hypothetical protein